MKSFPNNSVQSGPASARGWWALWAQRRRRARAMSMWKGDAFVPPDCKLWLQAQSLGLNLGDPIAVWGDSSGNENDASQVTVSSQPTFQRVTFAGKTFAVTRFDTVDDGMVTPLVISDPSPYSIFTLWKPADLGVTSSLISSGILNWMVGSYGGELLCYFCDWTMMVPVSGSDFLLVEVRLTPGQDSTYAFINGVQTTVWANRAGVGTAAPEQVMLGASGENGYPGGCDTPEIIIYDRLLSEEEAWGVRRYFQAKYNFLKL